MRVSMFTAATLAAGLSLQAQAGVQSLSSDEMVQTYIKDSAIIVVPRKETKVEKSQDDGVVRAVTISPGEPVVSDSENQRIQDGGRTFRETNLQSSIDNAEDIFINNRIALPAEQAMNAVPQPDLALKTPILGIDGKPLVIPDGPFNQTFLNEQLGLNFDGERLTFSIGNPPGISQINLPPGVQGINQGPVQLVPRPGGGFDLSIQVPKN